MRRRRTTAPRAARRPAAALLLTLGLVAAACGGGGEAGGPDAPASGGSAPGTSPATGTVAGATGEPQPAASAPPDEAGLDEPEFRPTPELPDPGAEPAAAGDAAAGAPAAPAADVPPPYADGSLGPGRAPAPGSTGREAVPSALADRFWPGFAPLIAPELIRPGGPPPDGIPAVDAPVFAPPGAVDFLADDEAVLALEIGGDARAYPLQIMTWHELVNDTVGGVPVTVSYCPLCNSAVAYDRNAAGRILDFGTTGMLYQSSMVMYDRQTQSLWTHFDGMAVIGELAGTRLDFRPMAIVSWAAWRDAHPGGLVLTRETGHTRAYGRNPYAGYETSAGLLTPAFQSVEIDRRLPAKERVVGIRTAGDAVAVRHGHLREAGTVEVDLDGVPLVVWNLPGASSALDGDALSGGLDVGSTGVFERTLDGLLLSFSRAGHGFTDDRTGSTWDLFGRATAGELAGRSLRPREFVDTFWFAWGAFEPESRIVPPPAG